MSLQAFIETMFASKAPVEEAFLYAKVRGGKGQREAAGHQVASDLA